MAKVKAIDVGSLRKLLRQRGRVAEAEFLGALPADLGLVYRKAMEFAFVPVDEHARFFAAAARGLFPRQKKCDEMLGREMAELTYSGVYRVFLRIPTVNYVIGRTAAMWRTYYDTGEATVENRRNNSAELVVRSFPELPASLRRGTTGHVAVLLERTGAKDVKIRLNERDPNAWRWVARWR